LTQVVAFRVTVPFAEEDRASGILWDCETRGIEVREAIPPGSVELIAYFESAAGLAERLVAALDRLPVARVEPTVVPDVDWVAHVREAFRPLSVGAFRILPAWQVSTGPSDSQVLIVDPGRAFGTGGHETTRLCLEALQTLASRRPLGRVLDLGAGSAILAIAALRLGARHAVALDNDPEALVSAGHHARLNAVSPSLVLADGGRALRPASFDTIVANVSAPLLSSRRTELLALTRPGGALILSGFLAEDLPALREAFASAGPAREALDGEWAALVVGEAESGRPA
jgi:ribosomal protein L11 methyltransferase